MQIRATVKWRQSLPLTRAASNHPSRSLILPLSARSPSPSRSPLDPGGCFSFSLTAGTPCHPLISLLRSSRSWFSHPGRGGDGDGTATPSRKGGSTHPPARFGMSNASAPGRTTRYIYALRFHWKILVPLEEPHIHGPHTRGHPPTHRLSLSSSSLGVLRHPGSHWEH